MQKTGRNCRCARARALWQRKGNLRSKTAAVEKAFLKTCEGSLHVFAVAGEGAEFSATRVCNCELDYVLQRGQHAGTPKSRKPKNVYVYVFFFAEVTLAIKNVEV